MHWQARGATVTRHNVYQRQCPTPDATRIQALRASPVDIVICTSVESLENLFILLESPAREWLYDKQFVVLSERIAHAMSAYPLSRPVWIAKQASDAGIIELLKEKLPS